MSDVIAERQEIDALVAGRSIAHAFADTVEAQGDAPAYSDKVGIDGPGWRTLSWRELRERALDLAAAFVDLGVAARRPRRDHGHQPARARARRHRRDARRRDVDVDLQHALAAARWPTSPSTPRRASSCSRRPTTSRAGPRRSPPARSSTRGHRRHRRARRRAHLGRAARARPVQRERARRRGRPALAGDRARGARPRSSTPRAPPGTPRAW